MLVVSTIRQRGQLTIPDRVREKYEWIAPGLPVSINTKDPGKIVIEPYEPKKVYDWDKIWAAVKRARSIKGKNKTSLSEFIVKDRDTHF